MLFKGTEEEFKHFLTLINAIHPCIKFTSSYDWKSRSTTFLDVKVSVEDGKLVTDLFRKPTDKAQYLLPTSFHPKHVCNSIPYSLALRLVRICSRGDLLEIRLAELMSLLKQRGYTHIKLVSAFARAKQIGREKALKETEKEECSRITFTTTYSPHLSGLSSILTRHWRAMTRNKLMAEIFPEPPMVAFRQPPNLKRVLCRAKLPRKPRDRPSRTVQTGLKKCIKNVCSCCPYLSRIKGTTASNTKELYVLKICADCNTTGVVYCLTCKKCKHQYIGQTSRRLKDRVQEHIRSIRKNENSVGMHFNGPGHSLKDLQVSVLEKVFPVSRPLLETREDLWIKTFGCIIPNGMNINTS